MNERDFLQKAERIVAALPQRLGKIPETGKNQIPEKQIITAQQATQMGAQFYLGEQDKILLLKGNTTVCGDVNKQWISELLQDFSAGGSVAGILIDGNLIVQGKIIDDDYLMLGVLGKVICEQLYSENGQIFIKGDLFAAYGIQGEYNDGFLHVLGQLDAPFILANDHDMPRESSVGEFIYLEAGEGSEQESFKVGQADDAEIGWGWSYFEHGACLLKGGVWNEQWEFSPRQFFDMVQKGQNPFADLSEFERNLAQWQAEADEEEELWNANAHEDPAAQPLANMLCLGMDGMSDSQLYEWLTAQSSAVLKMLEKPEGEKTYGQAFYSLINVLAALMERWKSVQERYSTIQQQTIAHTAITLAQNWGQHMLRTETPQDRQHLLFACHFCELASGLGGLIEDEIFFPFYETIVRLGLKAERYHDSYFLLRLIARRMPELAQNMQDVIQSAVYQRWLSEQTS